MKKSNDSLNYAISCETIMTLPPDTILVTAGKELYIGINGVFDCYVTGMPGILKEVFATIRHNIPLTVGDLLLALALDTDGDPEVAEEDFDFPIHFTSLVSDCFVYCTQES